MIVTVTLNPALDLTYAVDALVPHGTHRVSTVAERPGGKGLNVARVLHSLGEPVLATGLLGGTTGGRVAALLRTEGVASSFVDIAGETRRTVAVVDGADATGFWEPGPAITEAEWSRFADHFRSLLREASVITLSGSLPPGLPASAYATLIAYAREAGVPALLDTSGPALRHGLLATPALAKPNADELASLRPPPTSRDRADAPAYGAELAGAERAGAERAGAERAGAERAGAERAGAERAGAERAGAERAGAERAGAERAGAERAGAERAGAERAGAGFADLVELVRAVASGPVVVSRGAAGLLAIAEDEVWECVPPVALDGNPTGAGDACVAALARGLRDRTAWPELLADAVALSAAAVATPEAGAFNHDVYRQTFATATPLPHRVGPAEISGGSRARTHR